MSSKIHLYIQLTRLDRPIGIFLLLWPTLWALLIAAQGRPDYNVLLVFIAGVILMRSAGCAVNDFADRDIDIQVLRTRNRPLAQRKLMPVEALAVFGVLALIAFLLAVLFLNKLTLLYSLGAVALAASYPFAKRLHYLPQVHLGAAFAWAVPMAFVAINNQHPPTIAWLLFATTLIWTVAYDTLYGLADREDDIRIGVKSTAILFGDADRIIIGCLQLFVIVALIAIGNQLSLGWYYYAGVFCAMGLFIYQLWLIKDRDPKLCIQAFRNNNYVGMVIFIGLLLAYWLKH